MSRIAGVFETTRAAGRSAFVPFIIAGDPSPALTVSLCEALERSGADIIEMGVPFSDPLADGPTIQRASERALKQGTSLARCLQLASEARHRLTCPLVLFTYYNPILRMGVAAFSDAAAGAGIDGVLVTDLPMEEGGALRAGLIARDIDPILLVAPTTGGARLAGAATQARGFIYYISRTGVTGARSELPGQLASELAAVRRAVSLPVAVGFGISKPDQVRAVGAIADGVVVGSALVAVIEQAVREGVPDQSPARIERAARELLGRD